MRLTKERELEIRRFGCSIANGCHEKELIAEIDALREELEEARGCVRGRKACDLQIDELEAETFRHKKDSRDWRDKYLRLLEPAAMLVDEWRSNVGTHETIKRLAALTDSHAQAAQSCGCKGASRGPNCLDFHPLHASSALSVEDK